MASVTSEACSAGAWLRAARLFWSSPDLAKAIEAARACAHPDAAWLAALFPAPPQSPAQARAVILAQPESGRSCFFAAVAQRPWDRGLKLRAAELGYPLAQALLSVAALDDREAQFVWARRAAEQNDPLGTMLLGVCYGNGLGCAPNLPKSSQLILESARMGVELAQYSVALRYSPSERERFLWLGRAAPDLVQARDEFLSALSHAEDGECLFQMGEALEGQVGADTLFGHPATSQQMALARDATRKHDKWCDEARTSIDLWLLVGIRSGKVNRDVRRVVGKMLWAERYLWSNVQTTQWNKRARHNEQ